MTSSHPVLGNVIEICIATPDIEKSIEELKVFGIDSWKIYTFDTKDNITNATINGQPARFKLRVGFAQLTKDIAYEVIQPLDTHDESKDIFSTWLRARNNHAGVHHIAYDLDNIPWEQRLQKFESMGTEFVQGGTWRGRKGICQFAWFRKTQSDSTQIGSTSTFFETIKFSDDWEDPVPDLTL